MTTTFLQKAAISNDQDAKIARLKAAAFDLTQKHRDYQRIHNLFTDLQCKQVQLTEHELQKQADLKAALSYLTTTQASL